MRWGGPGIQGFCLLFSVSYSLIICSFRAKYHKLKFGTDLNQGEKKPELSEQGTHPLILPPVPSQRNWMSWRRAERGHLLFTLLCRKPTWWAGAGRGWPHSRAPPPSAALPGLCWAPRGGDGGQQGQCCLLSLREIDTQGPL